MLKRFNWRVALLVFVVLESCLVLTACPGESTATEVLNMLPALGTLLSAIVAFISGMASSVPSSVVTAAEQVSQVGEAALTAAEAEIKAWTQSTSPTVLGKVKDLLTGVESTLSSFLSGVSGVITNPATKQKITEFVELAVTTAEGVLELLPMFAKKLATLSPSGLKGLDKTTAAQVRTLHASLKERYKEIVSTPSGDEAVDAVLRTLPKM